MPLVKLTIKHEPVEVDDDELENLRGAGLLEKVLDGPAAEPGKPTPVPGRPAVPATPAADAGNTEEQK